MQTIWNNSRSPKGAPSLDARSPGVPRAGLQLLRGFWSILGCALAFLIGTLSPVVMAQSDERSAAFEAVEGSTGEEVSGFNLLVIAYIVFWLLLGLYALRIARLQSQTRQKLEALSPKPKD